MGGLTRIAIDDATNGEKKGPRHMRTAIGRMMRRCTRYHHNANRCDE
jgi:hypothetical protein